MAIDERLGQAFPFDVPAIRFFTWANHTISLGRSQNPERRLDLDSCRRDGLDVVRRPTGGKELLHGSDLCYSVIWPAWGTGMPIEAGRLFARINDIIVAALGKLGIRSEWRQSTDRRGGGQGPCFMQVERGEIAVDGRKLVASAQRIYSDAVLQQGSMPLRRPPIELSDYLARFDREEIRKKLSESSTYFYEHADETISVGSVVDTFKGEFERSLGLESRSFTKEVEAIIQDMLKTQELRS